MEGTYLEGIEQCVVDLSKKKVIALFKDVEDAETFVNAALTSYKSMAICHANNLHKHFEITS